MDFNNDEDENINEETVIESLFTGCDTEGSGLVRVSKLIEYLSAVAGDNIEFGGNFDDLLKLLDPKSTDREVNIEEYRNAMLRWIEDIRCRNYREDVYYADTSAENQAISVDEWAPVDTNGREDSRCMNATSESVEGLGGGSPLKQDWELVTKIEDLQLNNKRLVDHNAELSFQMENTEESNNQLLSEVKILRKQLRNYQSLDEKNKNIEKENEELRQTVTDLQETSRNFENKTKQLEKDRFVLSEFQEELQTKLSAAHRRLESLSNDHKNVCLAYNEEKQRLIELEELQGVKDEMDKESTGAQKYLTSVISELTAQKEALQIERNKMETELFQVREDLNRLMVRNASTFSSAERRDPPRAPTTFSTAANSLQQELQEITRNDCLPSPIVGHSPSFNQNSSYESDVFDSPSVTNSVASSLSLISLNSSTNSPLSKSNEYFAAVSQVAADFREKKTKALQTISELVHLEKTRENKEIRESLQRELEKEMEFFAEKIWLLSLARKASEKRVSKLLALIETLKDENHQLQDERDKALQKIGNLSLDSEDMETRMEELALELQASMENSKHLEKRCNELQNKLTKAESELKCIKSEKETLSASLERVDEQTTEKYRELERKYKELEDEHKIALAKVSQMEKQLERTSLDLAVEKKRSKSLQESLSLSVSKHEQELQEIMETIPTEDFDDSPSRTKSSAITGYQVRSRLRAFLVNKYLTVRDSPDGKPTNHDNEIPIGVSTPLDGNSMDSNVFSNPPSNISQNISNDKPRLADTPYPINKLDNSEEICDVSPENVSSSSKKYDDSSALSSISPNLIRPFDEPDDRWISPNLIEPFEGDVKNKTFIKPGHSTGLEEWRSNGDTPESLKDEDSLRKDRNLTEGRHSSGSSRNADENCAKNLLNDFSAEVTTATHPSARLSLDQHSEDVPVDNDSAPVSPAIPARFRKISNITPPRIRRKMGTGSPPAIVPSAGEAQSSPSKKNPHTSSNQTEPKLLFTFDGPLAQSYLNQPDNVRIPSRLTNSSTEGDRASESYDSDYKLSPGVMNSYIEGVSLNSSLPSDDKELEKLFKSVCLAFRTDKDSLPQRLEYQERACDAAEKDVVKALNVFSNSIQTLEENITAQCGKKVKDSLSSLYQQLNVLNDCSRRVSSQSHQYGSYQQEARMMSAVEVLINYGERLSGRLETLADTISAKQLQEQMNRAKESLEDTQTKKESSNLSRRGSSFYNFVSTMRTNDSFRLFSSGPEAAKTSVEPPNKTELNTEITPSECRLSENSEEQTNADDLIVPRRTKDLAKQRSCLGRCVCCSIKFAAFLLVLLVFFYILIQYSVFDRYFVVNKLHDYLKSRRFEMIYYEHEPAV